MDKVDLSILIPSRNEMFLRHTVEDILSNIEGNTEIIVVLDGEWAVEPLKQHPRLKVIYHHKSVGQRAGTNDAAKIARGKYLMKIDAHCKVDKGFDVKMIKEMKDDWTLVPTMYNLHVFDWKCRKCDWSKYQGRTPEDNKCPDCGAEVYRDIKWYAKPSPTSNFYRFDKEMKFNYWKDFEKRPEGKGDICPTLSLQGSCFMLTKEKYFELDICDEKHGSWGQQGTEVACKTWLSGGQVMVNKKTWYAHMFRTQGGDFSFPYPLSGRDVKKARDYSKYLWKGNNWPLAKHDLNWLLDKFYPVPDWHIDEESANKKLTKGVVYYTDCQLPNDFADAVRKQLRKGMKEKHIASVSLNKPLEFGDNILYHGVRGYVTMAKQILAGLKENKADVIFLCEHDVLYHPKHFDFIPPRDDTYYYNVNVWRVNSDKEYGVRVNDLKQLSGCVAYRSLLIKHFEKRVELLEKAEKEMNREDFNRYVRKMGFEPGTHGREERVDDNKSDKYQSNYPNLDIRHSLNLTASRWDKSQYRNKKYTQGWTEAIDIPGWGLLKKVIKDYNVPKSS